MISTVPIQDSLANINIDCKTVRIFAYNSSTRDLSNKRSATRLKTCEARALGARKTLTPRFTDFFIITDFEKKTDCLAV